MEKFFNTAGPIVKDIHYYVDPKDRWDFANVLNLIQQRKYFILHAPRQTGKTSSIIALAEYLNATGQYEAIYANVESAQAAREDVPAAMKAICDSLSSWHHFYHHNGLLKDNWLSLYEESGAHTSLLKLLSYWTEKTDKPTILLLDEVDALIGDTLISLLRQLREGYSKRPHSFPVSIVLCGVRDVRDYRIYSARSKEIITGGSAFNIKAESLRMENFTPAQVKDLYEQHTAATGQIFEEGILDLAWDYTAGQPWLVNALAYEVTFNIKENRDRSQPITVASFRNAKERLILRRDTHLDQLIDKLQEDRVHRVIAPILAGKNQANNIPQDDLQYVIDLGLVKKGQEKTIEISNEIYQEVIPRELTYTTQYTMHQPQAWYLEADGSLDMTKLLTAFQDFFRKNSEHWIQRFKYREAGSQLLLQAFLQRIVNGGGRITREYGLGRGRTDLFIEFFYPTGKQEIVIELKVFYSNLEQTIEKGIKQTQAYMDKCGTDEGHLLIFDRREKRTWEEKIWRKRIKGIEVWGC